ncbi:MULTISPECIES: hypothetical protein [unclassified Methylobacterium]|uniref:hypothetical protein n=1 Tax=unclassified Methylobacterium TaxID=2615210 RepID=UPI001353BAB9|nr:hypothetical protein [Methylobacterium sp. 2A]MWV25043.1 hypothetical protein [Methylobacterium sp. 2A]
MDEGVAQPGLSAGERKHRAKRFNEGLKLAANLFNSSAIATIGIAVINPSRNGIWICSQMAVGLC